MPYKTFHNWLFDGSRNSPLPKPTSEINLLKYNSPITHTYLLKMFIKNPPLNYYLNKYFNNIGVRYIDKVELFKFIKKCVLDFRVRKTDIGYIRYHHQTKLFNILREKLPILKGSDLSLLCKIIDKSPDKNSIYQTLNIEVIQKKKIKSGVKKTKPKNVSLNEFLKENFSISEKKSNS